MTEVLTNPSLSAKYLNSREGQFSTTRQITNASVWALKGIFQTLKIWNRRNCDRRRLAEMPTYLLRDMGISSGELSKEINKPFWEI